MTTLSLPPIVAAGTITDSLGREWDPLEHPRGRDGKFIHTFKRIRAFLNAMDTDPWMTGEVTKINPDGSIRVRIKKTTDPNLVDPNSGMSYADHEVDILPDLVESINEKAVLDSDVTAQKPSPFPSMNFGDEMTTWKSFRNRFFPDFNNITLGSVELDSAVNSLRDALNTGVDIDDWDAQFKEKKGHDFIRDAAKYMVATRVLSNSETLNGDDNKKILYTNDKFRAVLEQLGVDPDVIDDTPDGLSGFDELAGRIRAWKNPSTGLDRAPRTPGAVREVEFGDEGNRVALFGESFGGAESPMSYKLVDADGNVDPRAFNSFAEAREAALEPKADLAPEPTTPTPPPEPSELYEDVDPDIDVEPTAADLDEIPDDTEQFTDIDTTDVRDLGQEIQLSEDTEYGEAYSSSIVGIANGVEEGSYTIEDARSELRSLADEIGDEADDVDSPGLKKFSKNLRAAADNLGVAQKAELDESEELEDEEVVEDEWTPEQLEVLDEYVSASQDVNDTLRDAGDAELVGDLKNYTDTMDGIISEYALVEDTKVYRGINASEDSFFNNTVGGFNAFVESLKPGAVIHEKGYMSTSLNPDVANQFTKTEDNDIPGVFVEIDAPTGSAALPMDATPIDMMGMNESELLFPRNSRLYVESVEVDEAGVTRVRARLLANGEEAPIQGEEVDVPSGVVDQPEAEVAPELEADYGPLTPIQAKHFINYMGMGARKINKILRANKSGNLDDIPEDASFKMYDSDTDAVSVHEMAETLDELIDSQLEVGTYKSLYRGMIIDPETDQEFIDSLVPGAKIVDNGFMSTSTNPDVAESFATLGPLSTKNTVTFSLAVGEGLPAINVDSLSAQIPGSYTMGEEEFLFGRNVQTVIEDVQLDSNGNYAVTATLRPGDWNDGSIPGADTNDSEEDSTPSIEAEAPDTGAEPDGPADVDTGPGDGVTPEEIEADATVLTPYVIEAAAFDKWAKQELDKLKEKNTVTPGHVKYSKEDGKRAAQLQAARTWLTDTASAGFYEGVNGLDLPLDELLPFHGDLVGEFRDSNDSTIPGWNDDETVGEPDEVEDPWADTGVDTDTSWVDKAIEEAPLAEWEKQLLYGDDYVPPAPENDGQIVPFTEDSSLPGPDSEDWENMVDVAGPYRWDKDGNKIGIGDTVVGADGVEMTISKFENNNKGVIALDAEGKKRIRHRKKLSLVPEAESAPGTATDEQISTWEDELLGPDTTPEADAPAAAAPDHVPDGDSIDSYPWDGDGIGFADAFQGFANSANDGSIEPGDYFYAGSDYRVTYNPSTKEYSLWHNTDEFVDGYAESDDDIPATIQATINARESLSSTSTATTDPSSTPTNWPTGAVIDYGDWASDSPDNFAYKFAGFVNATTDGSTAPGDLFNAGDGFAVTYDFEDDSYKLWEVVEGTYPEEFEWKKDYFAIPGGIPEDTDIAQKIQQDIKSFYVGPTPDSDPVPQDTNEPKILATVDWTDSTTTIPMFKDANAAKPASWWWKPQHYVDLSEGYELHWDDVDKVYEVHHAPTGEILMPPIGNVNDAPDVLASNLTATVAKHNAIDSEDSVSSTPEPSVSVVNNESDFDTSLASMLDAIAEESYEDGDKIVWGTYQVTFHRISGNLELSDVYSGEIKTTVDVGEDFDTVTSILTDAIKNDVTPTPTPAVNESLGVPAPSGTMNVFSTWENDSETFAYDFAGFENDVSDGNTGPNDYFDAGDGYHVTNDSANGMWALWNITLDPDDPIAKYPQDGNAAASIQSAIKLQEVSGSAPLPITYDSNVELAKINDIPKNIGGVLELFGGQMTAGQAKQYRNAGYALDDAKDYAVDSPTWNQAVNKAIYNLTQSGPAGQLKLNQVNKWRTDTLNAHNGGVIESDTPVSDAVLPSGYATPPVDAKAIYTNASVAAESNSSISYAVVDADGKVAYYKSDGAVHPMNSMTEEVLKNHPGWVPYNGTEVSESTSQTSGPDLSQPHKMDMNNNPMFIGDKVFWTTKGIEVTVHKFENNDVGVIVTSVDANGNKKKHALNRKKLKLISSPSQAHSQAQNKSGPPPVNQYSAVTSATVEPDPSSPWFGKPQPEKPELDLIADPSSKKLVNDEWMKTANENYKKGAKAENPNWIEKELESSLTYGEYKAVQQGNTNSLNNLFTKGWITPDMHADALMQIAENNEAYELALEKNNEKLAAWRKDVKAWRDANGLPSITLKGMDDGVLKFDNHGAITWMNAHQKPGSLTPTGKLTGQSYNAVANQKSSNISSQLRAGKEKTLDPEWVAQNGGYSTLGLDQAMLDSPPLEQDFMVTRTLDMDNFINPATGSPYDYTDILSNSAGSIQHDWGFAETSVGSYDAGATVGYGSGRKIRMQLRVPKGTRGVWTNHPDQNFGYESERGFLLERGIAYYIHSVEWKNGHWAVNAEVIPKDVNYDQFGHFINENPFFN